MPHHHSVDLHIIGSGCPNARSDRYGSAFMLAHGDVAALIDCGPATTYKMARMGLDLRIVRQIFLTHHHFDHNADIPTFVLTRWDECRGTEPPLDVYGPPPTERFMDTLLGPDGAFAIDWRSRIEHPASHACHAQRGGILPRPPPSWIARDVGDGPIDQTGPWTVRAVRVRHVEPTMVSLAFRFETPRGGIVFTGDCADCESLRELAQGARTLVIACTHFGRTTIEPAIADVITGTSDVAKIANSTGVTQVVLTHMSPHFAPPGMKERTVASIARAYNGEVVCPNELDTLRL